MWRDTNQTEYWWNLTKTVYLCLNWGILMDFSIRWSYLKMCSKQPQRKRPLFTWNTSGANKSMGVRDRQSREQLTYCASMTQATGDSKMIVNQTWKKKEKKGQKSKRGQREGREERKEISLKMKIQASNSSCFSTIPSLWISSKFNEKILHFYGSNIQKKISKVS